MELELCRKALHCTAPGLSVCVCFRAGVTLSFLISAYGLLTLFSKVDERVHWPLKNFPSSCRIHSGQRIQRIKSGSQDVLQCLLCRKAIIGRSVLISKCPKVSLFSNCEISSPNFMQPHSQMIPKRNFSLN